MKKTIIILLAAALVAVMAAPLARAEGADDFKAIQKAVKQNPAYEPGKEVKWFKVLITDTKLGKDRVKISLPLSVVEFLASCCGDEHAKYHHGSCDVDFKTLLAEMKKAGPMSIVEISDEDALIKVWLE